MSTINSVGKIEKGWGSEEIWASTPFYCGKMLQFNTGAKFSMHFHRIKRETWYVLSGVFEVDKINTKDASIITYYLLQGDVLTNEVLEPHRIRCIKEGTIIEVSTADDPNDNYRVMPGDSQKELS